MMRRGRIRRYQIPLLVATVLVLCDSARPAQALPATNPQSVARSQPAAAIQSTPDGKVVIAVGGDTMTAADLEKWIQALPPEYREFYQGAGKHLLPQYIVRMKILSAQAVEQKLDEQPEVALAIKTARESILADAETKRIERNVTLSDQELQDVYAKQKSQLERVRVRHILIRTANAALPSSDPNRPALAEADARKKLEEVRQKILAGADFGQMAQRYSDDSATADSGGDMGFVDPHKVVPPLVAAAHTLAVSQVSDIITTPWGLEIIKVDEKHETSFEEARPALEAQVRKSKAEEVIQGLLGQYKVMVDEQFFGIAPGKQTSPASH